MNNSTEELYQTIGNWDEKTHRGVWDKWMWGTDCNAAPIDQCWDMNEMHVYGILCCLEESQNPTSEICNYSIMEILSESQYPELNIMHLHGNKKICQFSLRELIDQLECFQLNWGKFIGCILDTCNLNIVELLLKGFACHLGMIAHYAFSTDSDVLDDPQYITPLPIAFTFNEHNSDINFAIISRKTLRQCICLLFILFRIYYIIRRSIFIPQVEPIELNRIVNALKQHHIESSTDFFNVFQQMIYLAPGMRLVYRTNFAGMFNDVSQVIYFHYPKFCRQPQLSLKEIPSSNIHLLPLITQLIPEITICYDDDTYIPGLCDVSLKCTSSKTMDGSGNEMPCMDTLKVDRQASEIKNEWVWLVSCGEIFLLRVDGVHTNVYISQDHSLLKLVWFYLDTTKKHIGDEMLNANDLIIERNSMNLTAHGHLQFSD